MLDRSFTFMGRARDHRRAAISPDGQRIRLVCAGDDTSVRRILHLAVSALRRMGIAPQACGNAEIVLAEVLNNVVEHAYADHGRGVIEIEIERRRDVLDVHVRDDGRPMPRGEIPLGRPHDLDVPPHALPEGGFGWLLVRELTETLEYHRSANRNELHFCLALTATNRIN